MSQLLKNPVVLLITVGVLVGFFFPLGKLASEAGISSIAWAMIVSLGAVTILLPWLIIKRRFSLPRGQTLRYAIFAGILSFVIPNLLLFSVIPYVGSGYTGLMFALSPVFTLFLAVLFKLKGPKLFGILGIVIGLIGAAIVTTTRGIGPSAASNFWIILALLIPIALACGNVYRTVAWPKKASPDDLAFWSHVCAIVIFLILLVLTHNLEKSYTLLTLSPWLTFCQALIAGITFPIYFRLQRYGGPVLLSQVGYIAAAVGLIIATLFLNEQYSLMTWIGAAIILVGIAATIKSQIKENNTK